MLKRWTWLVLFVICLTIPITVNAAPDRYQWMFSDDLAGYFFDTKSIKYEYNSFAQKPDKTKINVWIKTVYTPAGVQKVIDRRNAYKLTVNNFDSLSYQLIHYIITQDKKICFMDSLYYSTNGTILDQYSTSSKNWDSIVPESIAERWHEEIWQYSSDKANSLRMELEASK